ncbi:hypothetical protein [Pilimelia anulata]|nr:hypothetical protein [Pilimelia anulata]
MLPFALMGWIVTTVAVDHAREGNAFVAVLFGAGAVWLVGGAVRMPLLGVAARSDRVIVRNLGRTIVIPWAEVVDIVDHTPVPGPAAAAGAIGPAIVRRQPGRPDRVVSLHCLGSYGVGRGPTPGERAAAGLRECLVRWRADHRADG